MSDFNDALVEVSEEETYKKRYADLRRHQQAERDRYERELAEARGQSAMPATREEVEEWSQKYPDVAKMVMAIAAEQTERLTGQKLREIEEVNTKNQYANAMKTVLDAHPDFMTLREDEDFKEWAKKTTWAFNALRGIDPIPVIEAIDYYKELARKRGKDFDRKAAASAVTTSQTQSPQDSKIKWTESMVNRLKPSEFLKYEEEIMKASQNPEFYDMTGAAR